MAGNFEIKVPINVKENRKEADYGNKVAEQIKKSLGSIGIKGGGKGGGSGFGKTGLKMAGILGAILGVLNSMSFIIKPIMSLLRAILILFFIPLIPLMKPVLNLLKRFLEAQKKALDSAPQFKTVEDPLANAAIAVANWALMIGAMIGEFLFILGKGAFDLGKRIGEWLFSKVIEPTGEFIANIILEGLEFLRSSIKVLGDFFSNVGIWIWERIIEPAFNFLKDVGTWIWDIIRTPFQWLADKVNSIISWFSDLPRRIGGFLGFAQGGTVPGPIGVPQLAVVHGGEEVIPIGGRSGQGIIININNPIVRQSSDIKLIANEFSKVLQRKMIGRIAQ